MEQNLSVLPIVIPIMCAPLAVLLHRPKFVWPLALAAAWSTFGVCCLILSRVLADGVITYSLGNWEPPIGIEFRIDILNAYLLPLVSGIGAVVMTYAPRSLAAEVPESRHGSLYATYLLCLTGLLGMTITGDAFNVFVFLEISSLSMYAMVSMGPDRRALMAAFRYLVMGTLGGMFYLIGVGLLYMMTGTLNMADLAARLPAVGENRTVLAGFAFLSVGLGLKIALFPLHLWLPNAYAYAPSAVTSFLAATATKVSVYMVLRFLFTIIGISVLYDRFLLGDILQALGLIGIFVASTVAIFQTNVKRMLAYSSIAQIGYIVLGISFGSATGLTGSLVHVFNHALMKGGLFMVLGCIAFRTGTVDLDDLKGMGRRMPWTMMAFVLGGLGMIGVPLTVGFVSKWYLVLAALEDGSAWIAVLLLLSSLLAVIYIWRVVEVAYFQQPPEGESGRCEAPLGLLIPTWVMIGATLFFGIYTDLTVGVARRAAEYLLGGSS
ncbi:MAG: monovalent cation/H+ antiporter subunit D family protein [Planctomycetota bacterium]